MRKSTIQMGPRAARLLVRSGFAAFSLIVFGACGGSGEADVSTAEITQAIAGGGGAVAEPSPAEEDYAVAVMEGSKRLGSGVLVDRKLVLTAHHVMFGITQNDDADIDGCRVGHSPVAPVENTRILVGNVAASPKQLVPIKRWLYDPDADGCSSDIMALELAEEVKGISFPPLALDALPAVGAPLLQASWGTTESTKSPEPPVRMRARGTVLLNRAGQVSYEGQSLTYPDGYLVSTLNPCSGDSGAGVLSNGALVGIHSNSRKKGESCVNSLPAAVPIANHVALIERFYRAIGRMPTRAGQPTPAALGGACAADNQCQSGVCMTYGKEKYCSKLCVADDACGPGLVCVNASAERKVCAKPVEAPVAPSCATPGGHSSGQDSLPFAVLLLGAAVSFRRIRRERRGEIQ